jgi:CheY-like chemotaxis protein
MVGHLTSGLLKGWSVLLIDDEEDSLELARYILEFYGATVATAVDGQDGIDQTRTIHPDFIISDISMPKVDGWDFIKQLKADPALAHIPVIALSAHALRGDRERAIAAGFNNYLTKPLTANTFMLDLLQLLTVIPSISQRLPANLPPKGDV